MPECELRPSSWDDSVSVMVESACDDRELASMHNDDLRTDGPTAAHFPSGSIGSVLNECVFCGPQDVARTGRLMWCRSLPFGYLDSPRQSCRVSEALAGEMRRRAAGRAIHFFCYVDDYLVIGNLGCVQPRRFLQLEA